MIEKKINLEHIRALYGDPPRDEMIIFMLGSGSVRGALIICGHIWG